MLSNTAMNGATQKTVQPIIHLGMVKKFVKNTVM
jgi:hypothetical protein